MTTDYSQMPDAEFLRRYLRGTQVRSPVPAAQAIRPGAAAGHQRAGGTARMSADLPEIRSRILVNRNHATTGDAVTAEVLVGNVHDDRGAGEEPMPCVLSASGLHFKLYSQHGWEVSWKLLAPPCPPEPRNGTSGQAAATANTVWIRSMNGWHDAFADESAPATDPLCWSQLYARHPDVTPLVAAPDLDELIAIAAAGARWHCDTYHDCAHFNECSADLCVKRRDLLTRYGRSVTP